MKKLSFTLNDYEEKLWEFFQERQAESDIYYKSNKAVLRALLEGHRLRHIDDWRKFIRDKEMDLPF
jgi:hypothetical protein